MKSIILKILITITTWVKLFITTLNQLIRVLYFSKFNPTIKKIKINCNEKCYIVGNGPSLLENLINHLEFLKTCNLVVVNDMSRSDYFEVLKPNYYVLADPCYWDKNVFKEYVITANNILELIRDKTTWPMYLIVPFTAYKNKDFRNIFSVNKNINLVYYNLIAFNGFKIANEFIYKHSLGMPKPQNVLIPCMMIAINLNFKEINLIGVDHTWTRNLFTNDKNQVCYANEHFYDNQNVISTPFRRIYGDVYKMHQILLDFSLMFHGYHIIKKYADSRNVKIVNRTNNSFIDAFDRGDLLE